MAKKKKRNRSAFQIAKTLGTSVDMEAQSKLVQGLQQYQTNPRAALHLLKQAIKLYEKIGECDRDMHFRLNMATAYSYLGQYNKAIEYLQPSLAIAREIGDHDKEALSLHFLGVAYRSIGQCRESIEYEQQFLAIVKKFGASEEEAKSLNNLGVAYNLLGRYTEAIDSCQQALAIARKIRTREVEAASLGNLGDAYTYLGHLQKAIEYHQQSLKIEKEIGNFKGESRSLGSLGNVYLNLGEYQQTIDYYQQWLTIAKKIPDRQGEMNALLGLGNAYSYLKDDKQAGEYYQQCLDIARELGNRQGEADSLLGFGNIFLRAGKHEQAIDCYQQYFKIAQKISDRKGKANAVGSLGNTCIVLGQHQIAINCYEKAIAIAQEIGDRPLAATFLHMLGVDFLETNKLTEAEEAFRAAIQIWESLRSDLVKDTHKVSIFDTQADSYRLLQKVLVSQNKTDEALEIAERGRARAFVELLVRRFSASLGEPNNESHLQGTIKPPTLKEIQEIAQEHNSTIIEYSIVDSDNLYIWVIKSTGEIAFCPVDLQPLLEEYNSLEQLAEDTRGIIEHGSWSDYKFLLQQLHQYLIKPIADLLPTDPNDTIIFIPQHKLFLIPFPALQDATGRFLIEQHTMLIAPSIKALELSRKQRERVRSREWGVEENYLDALVVGNPTMPKIPFSKPPWQLKSLPYAEQEAEEIASLLQTEAIVSDYATKVKVVQQMLKARLIHLATHGLLDDINRSGIPGAIALAASDNDNGFLTAGEILDLDLNAELVVLSACNSGRGKITGDGVIGLSRCLFIAGVPSLIVSLWEVEDSSTKLLMTQFYQNLQNGMNKAQALRQAMLATMQQYRNCPKIWAGFTLIGEAE